MSPRRATFNEIRISGSAIRGGAHIGRHCTGRGTRIDIDHVAVGIAEHHRTIPPGLRRRLEHPVTDDISETCALGVHVIHLEVQDDRPIHRGRQRACAEHARRACAADGERRAGRTDLDVLFASNGKRTGDVLVESRPCLDVPRDDSRAGKLHGRKTGEGDPS